jgi:hypothetical protein
MLRTQDDEQDAVEILTFYIGLADQDAKLVSAFLRSAGFEPGTSFPPDALVKLGVYCRLDYWEAIGVAGTDEDDLPSSHEVFEDVIGQMSGETPRFQTLELCRRVHLFALRRLIWPQTSGAPSFVLEDRSDPSEFLDEIAELLWDHRHLAAPAALCDEPVEATTRNEPSAGPDSEPDAT